jgi:murein DD-endopeptidase MepM/ murein hydrolase activator NlpD
MKRYLSLIIVPHDNSKMRNYRVSYGLLGTFLALAVLGVATLLLFVTTYGQLLVKSYEATELSKENDALRARNAQVDSLHTELVRMQTLGIQIKKMLGIGLSMEDSLLVASLEPIVNSPAISEDAELVEAARTEQQELLRAIPSLWPLKGYVTKEFYTTGGEKSEHYHPGMDIAAKRNTPIKTSAEGIVVTSGWDDTYGYVVLVDHGFGLTTLYGHNARNLTKVGDRVARGQTIGFVGSTGKSTAPHLHFEVKKNGVPVNPRNYLLN